MADLLTNFNSIKDAFGKYIVAPVAQFGLGGFVFDVEGATNVDLATEITDHYTESNFTVQDHIAIRPKRVRLDTYVGEICYRGDNATTNKIQNLARKLTVLNSYIPQLTQGAQQLKSIFDVSRENISFQKVVDSSLDLYSLVKNVAPPTTAQQKAYQYFKALMEQKILVSVQTPFEFCTNMAVESIFATQEEDSRYISNFSIMLKEIRIVSTQVSPFSIITNVVGDRAGVQNSPVVDGGKIQGIDVSTAARVDLFTQSGEALQ